LGKEIVGMGDFVPSEMGVGSLLDDEYEPSMVSMKI